MVQIATTRVDVIKNYIKRIAAEERVAEVDAIFSSLGILIYDAILDNDAESLDVLEDSLQHLILHSILSPE